MLQIDRFSVSNNKYIGLGDLLYSNSQSELLGDNYLQNCVMDLLLELFGWWIE